MNGLVFSLNCRSNEEVTWSIASPLGKRGEGAHHLALLGEPGGGGGGQISHHSRRIAHGEI